jgi:aspartate/methionine/tyrosine aminotransferase
LRRLLEVADTLQVDDLTVGKKGARLHGLKCLDELNGKRRENAEYLASKLKKFEGIIPPKVPDGYNSVEFASDLLEQVGVVVTPGIGYGKNGEGYVRLSLTIPDAGLVKGLSRLSAWRDSKNKFRKK